MLFFFFVQSSSCIGQLVWPMEKSWANIWICAGSHGKVIHSCCAVPGLWELIAVGSKCWAVWPFLPALRSFSWYLSLSNACEAASKTYCHWGSVHPWGNYTLRQNQTWCVISLSWLGRTQLCLIAVACKQWSWSWLMQLYFDRQKPWRGYCSLSPQAATEHYVSSLCLLLNVG